MTVTRTILSSEDHQADVDRLAAEVVPNAKDAMAVGVVIVKPDGSVRTLYAFRDGGKLPMLAGLTLLQHNICVNEYAMSDVTPTETRQ